MGKQYQIISTLTTVFSNACFEVAPIYTVILPVFSPNGATCVACGGEVDAFVPYPISGGGTPVHHDNDAPDFPCVFVRFW